MKNNNDSTNFSFLEFRNKNYAINQSVFLVTQASIVSLYDIS